VHSKNLDFTTAVAKSQFEYSSVRQVVEGDVPHQPLMVPGMGFESDHPPAFTHNLRHGNQELPNVTSDVVINAAAPKPILQCLDKIQFVPVAALKCAELCRFGRSENNLNSPDRMTDQRSSKTVVAPHQDSSDVKTARDLCQPSVV